ncbi:hypothetical protein PMES_02458 [Profundibacterium mesophilum KAUST100406-0324]|uniref:Uncharacterized protein n=2 Tax=Profundibacterium TaxID=1258570 RepID=A0A921TBA3_9RHOB|nr:hypothetical protein PMES_02458 [Profundibacterium mesophilum KAUST100406-0324]
MPDHNAALRPVLAWHGARRHAAALALHAACILSGLAAALPANAAPGMLTEGSAGGSALPGPVTVTRLGAPELDRIGLYPAQRAGLDAGLWGATSRDVLVRLIAHDHSESLPALRDLFTEMLLAELDPPREDGEGTRLFLARVDALLMLGDLAGAQALIDAAQRDDPEFSMRRFDIALLSGTEDLACQRMRERPGAGAGYAARVFCLARSGEWDTAALTLESAEALDLVSGAELDLLHRFLEIEHEDAPPSPPKPRHPTPLEFTMFEAIGEPYRTAGLPLIYAHADLRPIIGWKARLEAAERLARAGAISPERLWDIYGERSPAASGGLWDRVGAVQKLEAALREADADAVGQALPTAWRAMQAAGLELPLARQHGAALARLPLEGAAARIALEAGLLSGARTRIAGQAIPQDRQDAFLIALARGVPQSAEPQSLQARAIAEGFETAAPPPRLAGLLREGRSGEALLLALDLLDEGEAGNYEALRDGIALLLQMGLRTVAIETGLQLLLLERRG